ncbi:unnamed protein product [Darwinula stevensoni]|uniref:CWH43-like N-terminal domain-containing protein n=1 Tax=Darwinula stevensoni TaxID=69355 RepID=A0A7R8X1U6_9CRUS|nr:unnamed protein product [Darwinula stevensoni]CAG0883193.1 unnamed protein product [Darwinula stevensoni]
MLLQMGSYEQDPESLTLIEAFEPGRKGTSYQHQTCRVRMKTFAVTVVSMPFFAFLICILWSIFYNFEESTATHCHVMNYLPSISAAIGYEPQTYIWKVAIAIHFPPRLLVASYYYTLFKENVKSSFIHLSNAACVIHVVENFALVGLSFVTSRENFEIHKTFFVIFLICSEAYMMLSLLLFTYGWRLKYTGFIHKKSVLWKCRLAALNLACCVLTVRFYQRHNALCEPLMYTWFCLAEYVVVLSNMGFHMTAYLDFHDKIISVPRFS